MSAINEDILQRVRENSYFQRELVTNEFSQLILMCIEPGNDIGEQVHDADEILIFVEGTGEAVLNRQHCPVDAHSLVVVPAGVRHNIINTGNTPLKLLAIFAPPEYEPGALERTKLQAVADD